jgi:putative SOS response-associated peptidase YedK
MKGDGGRQQPYAIARADGQKLAFAGLWEGWRDPAGGVLRTFPIVTTEANAEMSKFHNRMPVILEPAAWPVWIGEKEGAPADLLRARCKWNGAPLLRPPGGEQRAKQWARFARYDR